MLSVAGDYRQGNRGRTLSGDLFLYDDNAEFNQYVKGKGLFNDGLSNVTGLQFSMTF